MRKITRSLAAAALAGAILTPAAVAPAHAEEPVQMITQPSPLFSVADQNGWDFASGLYDYKGNWTSYAKLTTGQTIVGNGTTPTYTGGSQYNRTWIPWSGREVVVAEGAYALSPTVAPSEATVNMAGAILDFYLRGGGEDTYGRPQADRTHTWAGPSVYAAEYWHQLTYKGTRTTDIVHSNAYGTHAVTGTIYKTVQGAGGYRHIGLPRTSEYTVAGYPGVVYQDFGNFRAKHQNYVTTFIPLTAR